MSGVRPRALCVAILATASILAPVAVVQARKPRVFVNGDSLAVGTRPYLPRALPGFRITQSTSISRHAPEGVAVLRAQGRRLARIVVMQLGTNDDPRADGEFRRAIRRTMHVVGRRRCVVWPNIVRPPVAGASYAAYNRALAAQNRLHENLLVVDWVGMARRHPEWFGPDGVHPDASGYRARARAIARKVRGCLERL
jgi:lysophospholipase L1-like esterase